MQDSAFFHCVSCLSTISSCTCAMMKEKCLNKNNPNAIKKVAFGLFHIYRIFKNAASKNTCYWGVVIMFHPPPGAR